MTIKALMPSQKQFLTDEFTFYKYFFISLSLLLAVLSPFSYGDLAVWIAEGRQVFLQKTFYIQDIHSLNQTASYPYPWLSAVFYYLVDEYAGSRFIFILHRLIPVGITYFWIAKNPAILQKKYWLVLLISLLGMQMVIIDRPALLALPLMIYFFNQIESGRIFKEKPYLSLFLLALWGNLHGSFALFFILYLYQAGSQFLFERDFKIKNKIILLVAFFAATCLNPWGYRIYEYVYLTAQISKVRMLEWQATSLFGVDPVSSALFYITLTVLLLFLVVRKEIQILMKSSFLVLIASAVSALRNIPLFFVTLPFFLTKVLPRNSKAVAKPNGRLQVGLNGFILLSFFVLSLTIVFDDSNTVRSVFPKQYSQKYDDTVCEKIAAYLKNQNDDGAIFNEWRLGSYLMYAQNHKIFVDTRNIIYSNETVEAYDRIISNSQGNSLTRLDEFKIKYVVVYNKRVPLIEALQASSQWKLALVEDDYQLFERQ